MPTNEMIPVMAKRWSGKPAGKAELNVSKKIYFIFTFERKLLFDSTQLNVPFIEWHLEREPSAH